jgi:transcriptional regulator with XRE-family HTH domain
LAEKLGAAPDTVYSWFRGEHPPDAFDLETLAGLLGVSRWEILAAMDGEDLVVDLRSEQVTALLRTVVDAALDERQVPRQPPARGGDAA